jgi:hypothetical protein
MKQLDVCVDGRVIFTGEVAEVGWSENDEQVSVTGRFNPAPNFLQQLQAAAAQRQAEVEAAPPGAVYNGPPTGPEAIGDA